MLRWPIIFLVTIITTAVLGLTDISDYFGNIVMIVFAISSVSFLVSLVMREIALTKKMNKEKRDYLNTH